MNIQTCSNNLSIFYNLTGFVTSLLAVVYSKICRCWTFSYIKLFKNLHAVCIRARFWKPFRKPLSRCEWATEHIVWRHLWVTSDRSSLAMLAAQTGFLCDVETTPLIALTALQTLSPGLPEFGNWTGRVLCNQVCNCSSLQRHDMIPWSVRAP